MELRHLRYFTAVAEELSFRRAAERLHLSQPPLSRQIQDLETELGVRLLERDRRSRIVLTDAGNALLADARQILTAVETAGKHAREASSGARGRLNIANVAVISADVLPRYLGGFRQEFPNVEIFLVEMPRPEQLAALGEGRIHVGFARDPGTPLESRFQARTLLTSPTVALLPANHPLADGGRSEISLHCLADEVLLCLRPETSGSYAQWLAEVCATANFTPHAMHPVDGAENLFGMVAAGYGVAIIPEAATGSMRGVCQIRRIREAVPSFRLQMIWLRESSSLVLKNFLAVARRVAVKEKSGAPPAK